MGSADRETTLIKVGLRLRDLREERGVSMRTLARQSGLSANALSMIERGLTSPSVNTLTKLADALAVPITAFFRHEPDKQTVVFRKAQEHGRSPFQHGAWEGLGGEAFVGRVDAVLLSLQAGGGNPPGINHSGSELVYCLAGTLQYEVDGQHFTLEAGDSLFFDARLNHNWLNANAAETRALIVFTEHQNDERPAEFHIAAGGE